jgi:hypothetical protein
MTTPSELPEIRNMYQADLFNELVETIASLAESARIIPAYYRKI